MGIEKSKIKIHLHLYSDMNIENETTFWSETLKIQKKQFMKPYIKDSLFKKINRGSFGHGTCTIRVGNAKVAKETLMGLRVIQDHFGP